MKNYIRCVSRSIKKKVMIILLSMMSMTCVHADHGSELMMVGLVLDDTHYGIVDTLKPFVESGVTRLLILDRGLSVENRTLIDNYVRDKSVELVSVVINATLDDGQAHNQLLTAARSCFPDTLFICMPDAGWCVRNVSALIDFCKHVECEMCPLYYMRCVQDSAEQGYRPYLVRCTDTVVFNGAVRARAQAVCWQKIPDDIFAEQYAVYYGIVPYKERIERDIVCLLRCYAQDPHDVSTLFDLACCYGVLGDYASMAHYYQLCGATEGVTEEKFLAFYRLGCMVQHVEQRQHADHMPVALHYYLKAHELFPDRAELLIKMAHHYAMLGNFNLAYYFAYKAFCAQYPEQALLPVDRNVYTFIRYDLLGQYAWYVQQYEIGALALEKAIEQHPDYEYLHKNLQFYRDHTGGNSAHKGLGVPFIESMKHGNAFDSSFLEQNEYAQKIQEQYHKYIVNALTTDRIIRIPKIIHQIWLGGPLPIRCQALQASWKAHHPDWLYILWTDDDIEQFGLHNKKAYDAATTYGEKADIARYEILYRMGGLYIDTDFECVQSFDRIHELCAFYAGVEGGDCLIGNSLIGSMPGHPVLKQCITSIVQADVGEVGWQGVANRTGPGLITRSVKEFLVHGTAQETERCVIFPTSYFFPWFPYFGEVRTATKAITSVKPETYAVHHWHSSWVK